MFEGFARERITVGDNELDVLTGGRGEPLLLLHGYPQTRVAWHAVAPALAERFRLVIPDLPGYGDSTGPAPDPENNAFSKRRTATTMVELMAALGHERFHLAGHDRGGRLAYRLAFDHPDRVLRLALLDIVPTVVVWEEMGWEGAIGAFHWPFLAQPAPLPERMIAQAPDLFIGRLLDSWAKRPGALAPDAVAAYLAAFRKPSVIAASCADYRAGATVDLAHDRATRSAGTRLSCPTLILWGRDYGIAKGGSPLKIWQGWAESVQEVALDCGHFLAEEQPDACAGAMIAFLAR